MTNIITLYYSNMCTRLEQLHTYNNQGNIDPTTSMKNAVFVYKGLSSVCLSFLDLGTLHFNKLQYILYLTTTLSIKQFIIITTALCITARFLHTQNK